MATIYIPIEEGKKITENGQDISRSEDISFIKKDKDCFVYQIGSGSYSFCVE